MSGIGLTKGLSKILCGIAGREPDASFGVFTISTGDVSEIAGLVETMNHVARTQKEEGKTPVTEDAKLIVDKLILPMSLLSEWQSTSDRKSLDEKMASYFSKINIIGYSYGTSLVQQIDAFSRQRLQEHNLPITQLEKVMALNIGPVAHPPLDGAFQQLFMFKNTDKVMNASLGRALLREGSEAYDVYSTGRTVCLGEYCGDEYLRFLAADKFPSGHDAPIVVHQLDSEGHDLRLYTNFPEKIDGKDGATYPSSIFGCILREAASLMCSRKGDLSFKDGGILSKFLDCQEGATAKLEAKKWVQEWAERFDGILRQYRTLGFKESINFLRQEARSMSSAKNAHPFPQRTAGRQAYLHGVDKLNP